MKKLLMALAGLALAAIPAWAQVPTSASAVNITGTAGAGFVQFRDQSSAPSTPTSSLRIYSSATNLPSWINSSGTVSLFVGSSAALTSGRVPFVTTGGLLTDAGTLTFSSGTLTATSYIATGSSAFNVAAGVTPFTELEVDSTSTSSPRGIMTAQYSTGTDGARFHMRKARGTRASPTTIVTGDNLGRIVGTGYDGSNYLEMASILFGTEGTVASTRVPTNISFWTGTNAAPSVLTQRLLIDSAGLLTIASGNLSAASSTDLTLAGGSSGASLVLGQGSTGISTLSNASGTGGGVSLRVSNSSAVTGGNYATLFDGLVPNLVATNYAEIAIGVAASSYNKADMAFQYNGSGSTNNRLAWGFYGANNLMQLVGTGNLLIGTTTDAASLSGGLVVNGSGSGATASSTTTGTIRVTGGGGFTGAVFAANFSTAGQLTLTGATPRIYFLTGQTAWLNYAVGGAFTLRDENGVTSMTANGNAFSVPGSLTVSGGNVGVGGATTAAAALRVISSGLVGASQYGVIANPTFASDATVGGTAAYIKFQTAAAAFTQTSGYGIAIDAPTIGAASAVTMLAGISIANQGASGITNAYGIDIAAQSGAATTNVGLRNAGTTLLNGNVTITKPVANTPSALTYASPTSVDVTLANVYTVTTVNATGSVTFNATAGGTAGQRFTFIITNDATSAKTITFGTNFSANGTLTPSGASKVATIEFMSNGTTLYELCRTVLP